MALLQQAAFTQLETLIGDAYALVQGSQGDQDTLGTVVYKVTKAKTLIRGGLGSSFGVEALNPLADADTSGKITAVPNAQGSYTGYNVGIPTTAVVFGGVKKIGPAIPTFSIGEYAASGDSLYTTEESFYAVLVARDQTASGIASVGYAVALGPISRMTNPIVPTISNTDVRLANILVYPTGIDQADIDTSVQEVVYRESIGDDTVINSLYSPLNTLEDAQASKVRSEEFRTLMTSLQNYYKTNTGKTLKQYWREQGYQFTKNFRNLYRDVNSEELSVNVGAVSSYSASLTWEILGKSSAFEGIMQKANGAATSRIDLFCISPGYTKTRITNRVAYRDTYLWPLDVSGWPDSGIVGVQGNPTWLVTTYTKVNPSVLAIPTTTATYAAWSQAYNLSAETAYILPGIATGSAVSVGTGAYYLGIVGATHTVPSTLDLQLVLRSK